MQKAMDTAVTVCHFILVATVRVSTKKSQTLQLEQYMCTREREGEEYFDVFSKPILKNTPSLESQELA